MEWLFILLWGNATSSTSDWQREITCDSVYTSLEVSEEARLISHRPADLINSVIIPPLSDLKKEYGIPVSSLTVKIIVDREGIPIEAEVVTAFPKAYQEKISQDLIREARWMPATLNGEKVCSQYMFHVSCINWRD